MSQTTNVLFACDESGAKGYSDQREAYAGEVGVFAGILIPHEVEPKSRPVFQNICDNLRKPGKKLHIVDLSPPQQEILRHDIFAAIRRFNLPCFWYAIHVEGLYDWYQANEKLHTSARHASATVDTQPRYKSGSPRENRLSMHEELFAGLYSHLIAFLAERQCGQVEIEVRTDRIDSTIIKRFRDSSDSLLEAYPHVHEVTAWDSLTEKVVKGSIKFDVEWPDSMGIDVKVKGLQIVSGGGDNCYVLAADVLANSLYFLFKTRSTSELYKPLNEPSAIRKHELLDNLAAFHDWGDGDLIGDRLYKHPKG